MWKDTFPRLASVCAGVGMATGHRLEGQGLIPGRGHVLFSTPQPSRPDLGSAQPPGSFPGVKRTGREVTTHFHLVPGSRMAKLYFTLPYFFKVWFIIN